jgi:hypothetical protein
MSFLYFLFLMFGVGACGSSEGAGSESVNLLVPHVYNNHNTQVYGNDSSVVDREESSLIKRRRFKRIETLHVNNVPFGLGCGWCQEPAFITGILLLVSNVIINR